MGKPIIVSYWQHGVEAVAAGLDVLKSNGSALDAVEAAIMRVEDDPSSDTVGTGGIPNVEGVAELDASLMVGNTMRSGAVACLSNTKNPISVARKVMEVSPHVFLCGEGAQRFARAVGFPKFDTVTPEAREKWRKLRTNLDAMMATVSSIRIDNLRSPGKGLGFAGYDKALAKALELMVERGEISKLGTVGALSLDASGMIAAGTSTSGWPLRMPGRVADSSVIGAGTYATPHGASSATGIGEIIIRHSLTKRVCDLIEEEGYHPTEACESALKKMLRAEGHTSIVALIALDKDGRVGGATTEEKFSYVYQGLDDAKYRQVTPTPVSP
jgi:beta-aspartyl-peptidase (threonine type)